MISGETKVVGLIGDPVTHSISPNIHNSAFRERGLDYVYVTFRVAPENLYDAIAGIKSLELEGVNVTVPHKTAVIGYLDETDDMARKIGAVNTIKRTDESLKGFNTDGMGARRALGKEVEGIGDKEIVLLGAGGAARAIAFTLADLGSEVTISNRTVSKAEELVAVIGEKTGVKVNQIPQRRDNLKKAIRDSDILINSTSVGMHPTEDETLVEAEDMHADLTVMDIVYNPLPTRLLQEAERAGAKTIDGLEMLVQQGAAAFEIWTGESAPVEIMRRAAQEAMGGK